MLYRRHHQKVDELSLAWRVSHEVTIMKQITKLELHTIFRLPSSVGVRRRRWRQSVIKIFSPFEQQQHLSSFLRRKQQDNGWLAVVVVSIDIPIRSPEKNWTTPVFVFGRLEFLALILLCSWSNQTNQVTTNQQNQPPILALVCSSVDGAMNSQTDIFLSFCDTDRYELEGGRMAPTQSLIQAKRDEVEKTNTWQWKSENYAF